MRPVAAADISSGIGEDYTRYVRHFLQQRASFARTMASFGVPVSHDVGSAVRIAALRQRLESAGARFRNGGKSISFGSISPACARCRTGVKSVSEFLSLACHRSCWFCFNENQCDYHLYKNTQKDWSNELSAFRKTMDGLDYVALTGGEPLLFPGDACAFFEQARRENPSAHLRLYTSGDQLTPSLLERLRDAGVDEIRFSVKLDDAAPKRKKTLETLRRATDYIPAVMVEMPVFPGTHDEMTHLLRALEQAGAFGINLLELCFPLHHAKSFTARKLQLKANPYEVLYDYGYAGALPIEGSEELALRLMLEEIERGTHLHLHYCSLENKNTAQIYEQNGGGARTLPLYSFSHENFFYVTLRCFGPQAFTLADALDANGCAHALDEEGAMVQFAPADLPAVKGILESEAAVLESEAATGSETAADIKLFAAFGVIERDDTGAARFREVDLLVVEPADYQALYESTLPSAPETESYSGDAIGEGRAESSIQKLRSPHSTSRTPFPENCQGESDRSEMRTAGLSSGGRLDGDEARAAQLLSEAPIKTVFDEVPAKAASGEAKSEAAPAETAPLESREEEV